MRVLLITRTNPTDTSFGAAQRTALMHRALLEHGDVDVVVLNFGSAFAATAHEESGAMTSVTLRSDAWYSKYSANADARRWAGQFDPRRYDLVVARELSTAAAFSGAIDAPLVADADDASYRYAPSGLSLVPRTLAAIKTRARARVTHRALERPDHVWFASARDRQKYMSIASSLLPNVVPEVAAEAPRRDGPPTLLFVGALWYGPNIEAVNWFVAQCWPAISRSVTDVRLRIVGACPVSRRNRWSRIPGVECTGFAADLAAEYRAADFTVAPVRFGGGTQIKTLESLAYGRTAVVSSFVHAGYGTAFPPGSSLIVADSAAETIAHCTRLLHRPDEAMHLARIGHEIVRAHFGWQAFRGGVANGVAHALSDR